jgi:hypothetical protein
MLTQSTWPVSLQEWCQTFNYLILASFVKNRKGAFWKRLELIKKPDRFAREFGAILPPLVDYLLLLQGDPHQRSQVATERTRKPVKFSALATQSCGYIPLGESKRKTGSGAYFLSPMFSRPRLKMTVLTTTTDGGLTAIHLSGLILRRYLVWRKDQTSRRTSFDQSGL